MREAVPLNLEKLPEVFAALEAREDDSLLAGGDSLGGGTPRKNSKNSPREVAGSNSGSNRYPGVVALDTGSRSPVATGRGVGGPAQNHPDRILWGAHNHTSGMPHHMSAMENNMNMGHNHHHHMNHMNAHGMNATPGHFLVTLPEGSDEGSNSTRSDRSDRVGLRASFYDDFLIGRGSEGNSFALVCASCCPSSRPSEEENWPLVLENMPNSMPSTTSTARAGPAAEQQEVPRPTPEYIAEHLPRAVSLREAAPLLSPDEKLGSPPSLCGIDLAGPQRAASLPAFERGCADLKADLKQASGSSPSVLPSVEHAVRDSIPPGIPPGIPAGTSIGVQHHDYYAGPSPAPEYHHAMHPGLLPAPPSSRAGGIAGPHAVETRDQNYYGYVPRPRTGPQIPSCGPFLLTPQRPAQEEGRWPTTGVRGQEYSVDIDSGCMVREAFKDVGNLAYYHYPAHPAQSESEEAAVAAPTTRVIGQEPSAEQYYAVSPLSPDEIPNSGIDGGVGVCAVEWLVSGDEDEEEEEEQEQQVVPATATANDSQNPETSGYHHLDSDSLGYHDYAAAGTASHTSTSSAAVLGAPGLPCGGSAEFSYPSQIHRMNQSLREEFRLNNPPRHGVRDKFQDSDSHPPQPSDPPPSIQKNVPLDVRWHYDHFQPVRTRAVEFYGTCRRDESADGDKTSENWRIQGRFVSREDETYRGNFELSCQRNERI